MLDVIVVGAGPVGLLLACRLAQLGVGVKVLESHLDKRKSSRAIGIHPPSLERLEQVGLAHAMIQKGIKVKRGKAFTDTNYLGDVNFETCPKPYTFVLTLPQWQTEQLLEEKLLELAPDALERGVKVTRLEQSPQSVRVHCQANEHEYSHEAKFVVSCDGKHSHLRDQLGISFDGHIYPDSYLMGDFADSTDLGCDAGVYLTSEGLVEAFPLPQGIRRWVAKTDVFIKQPKVDQLIGLIRGRIGIHLEAKTNQMLSSFRVQRYLANQFAKGRVLLAGDAAHVLSPIGGQGMNLGWLDAWEAATKLTSALASGQFQAQFEAYDKRQRRAAKRAARRAEYNMYLGRKTSLPGLKNAFVKSLLNSPLERVLAKVFTMRWL